MKTTIARAGALFLLAGIIMFLAPYASATVVGGVQTSADSGGGQVTVTDTTITFTPGMFGLCPTANLCDFSVSGGNMTYSGGNVTTAYNGTFANLVLGNPPPSPFAVFYTAAGVAAIDLFITAIVNPTTTNGVNCLGATAGQTCVAFAMSPITLLADGGGSGSNGLGTTASLGLVGTALDIATGQTSAFTGKLSETIDNMSPGDVQKVFCGDNAPHSTCNNGAQITTGHTGSFTASVVPEPSTAAFFLIGGALIGLNRLRKRA